MIVTTAEKMAELMPDATRLLSDEPEMESSLHYAQLALLVSCLEWHWRERNDYFIGANLTIYFSRQQLKNRDFRGPDFFLVKGANNAPRPSWVVWEEGGKYPDLIIELLSDSTAEIDRDIKKEIYQDRFRTPEYFWFSPDTLEFCGFQLDSGFYVEILPDAQGRRWSNVLNLSLGIVAGKLRYFTSGGELVPTMQEETSQAIADTQEAWEEADQAWEEADQAWEEARVALQRAEHEAQRAERLAAKLRELGVDPNQLSA